MTAAVLNAKAKGTCKKNNAKPAITDTTSENS